MGCFSNSPISLEIDYVLGKTPGQKLTGVILADGTYHPTRSQAMSPDE
ncbi:hypothetical protein [Cuspidothrix issatschenkoi]|nr:hypothetical protein [Cuspidothrix issatschenkoi]